MPRHDSRALHHDLSSRLPGHPPASSQASKPPSGSLTRPWNSSRRRELPKSGLPGFPSHKRSSEGRRAERPVERHECRVSDRMFRALLSDEQPQSGTEFDDDGGIKAINDLWGTGRGASRNAEAAGIPECGMPVCRTEGNLAVKGTGSFPGSRAALRGEAWLRHPGPPARSTRAGRKTQRSGPGTLPRDSGGPRRPRGAPRGSDARTSDSRAAVRPATSAIRKLGPAGHQDIGVRFAGLVELGEVSFAARDSLIRRGR